MVKAYQGSSIRFDPGTPRQLAAEVVPNPAEVDRLRGSRLPAAFSVPCHLPAR